MLQNYRNLAMVKRRPKLINGFIHFSHNFYNNVTCILYRILANTFWWSWSKIQTLFKLFLLLKLKTKNSLQNIYTLERNWIRISAKNLKHYGLPSFEKKGNITSIYILKSNRNLDLIFEEMENSDKSWWRCSM